MYCDTVGCDEEAVAVDDMDNLYCMSCLERAIDEDGLEYENFVAVI